MPKIKIPKHSPSIDMTPMVDLAFLLVTFFMLTASFRSNEPVDVEPPSSISDKIIPENVLLVTIDKGGRVFMNLKEAEARRELLQNMSAKYKIGFSEKQYETFAGMSSFGCTMKELPGYIDMGAEERKKYETKGIPSDSTNNQLKDWIFYGNIASLNSGKTAYEEAKAKGDKPEINDFKPKFILKVDGQAVYVHAQNVINVFRDLHLNNLNFVTSAEATPK
ncbi:MAG: biopolymer transporter ExbD [Bacteroidota bacterium]